MTYTPHHSSDISPMGGQVAVYPNLSPTLMAPDQLDRASARQIGDQIRFELQDLLARHSLTQKQLADKLFYAQGTVARWIGGQRTVSPKGAAKLDELGDKTTLGVDFSLLVKTQIERTQSVRPRPAPGASLHDIFLASPMASADSYTTTKRAAEELAETIESYARLTVYNASSTIESPDDFDSPDLAFEENVTALENCRHFVLFLTERVTKPSSVWVEAGIAIALAKPSTYFAPNPDCLPYILRRAVNTSGRDRKRAPTAAHWTTNPRLLVRRNREALFSLIDP